MTTTKSTAKATAAQLKAAAWGTAKTHGLKAGDQFWYFGRDRKAADLGKAKLMTYRLDLMGGVATRFWATPVAAAPAKKKAASPVTGKSVLAAAAAQAKKAPAKAAPAKKAPAAKKPVSATPGRQLQADVAKRVPTGYVASVPRPAFTLARKLDKAVDGPAWLVICNTHLTITEAENPGTGAGGGRRLGRHERATWCKGCKADEAKAAKAAK